MTEVEILDAIKQDLRIDGDDMDNIVARKKVVAEEYVRNAGCKVDYDNPLCLEIVTRFVGRQIDNPEIETGVETGMQFVGLLEQLRLSQEG
ncbi:hypothetical protein SELR_18180 [Selenomonas ruminantium subsp. lactilytica TAM6421]|uniref:Phage gp6-like head-tail connector protein n=1 Tax=Selenomonas ruminantium subsp. lactilytica (strain NBRC 103574 / TAM6421) TaxID=927704 RepID=I0GRY9_SELRL|nr:head-tail connector protein [Selenomonas ruminantium]BAL83526.1 hypothetical protein SELR_18180 [Selenomonas ruminantium subsp. lactilytica TAM6421]